jgi:protein-tyrosine phosphatase
MSKNDMAPCQTVLFLCTGNYYRSRFAELYFNALAGQRALAWRADSRGLQIHPGNPGPISWFTVHWLQTKGIQTPTTHRSPIPLVEADLRAAAYIVAVKEAEHRPMLEAQFPGWADRVEYWHIHDLDCAMPEHALVELTGKVEELVNRLKPLPV